MNIRLIKSVQGSEHRSQREIWPSLSIECPGQFSFAPPQSMRYSGPLNLHSAYTAFQFAYPDPLHIFGVVPAPDTPCSTNQQINTLEVGKLSMGDTKKEKYTTGFSRTKVGNLWPAQTEAPCTSAGTIGRRCAHFRWVATAHRCAGMAWHGTGFRLCL